MEEGRGSATTSETGQRESWRPRIVGSIAALVPVAIMGAFAHCAGSMNATSIDGSGRRILTQWSGDFLSVLFYGAIVSFIVVAVWATVPVRTRPHVVAVILAAFACLAARGFAGITHLRSPWMAASVAVVGADGAAYCEGGDGDGGRWLVRRIDRRWDRSVGEIVANVGRTQDCAGLVIRAAAAADAEFQVDGSGRIFAVGDTVGLVFDPNAPREDFDCEPPRRPQIEFPSPFVLLRTGDVGAPADVERVLARIHDYRDKKSYLLPPSDAALLAALDSPNPWIVDTAKRFIEAGGPTLYPTATARLPR